MFKNKLQKIIAEVLDIPESEIKLDSPTDPNHGDYATNIALKQKLNPEEIAKKLSKDKVLKQYVSKVEAVKPGFINFHLSEKTLKTNLEEILSQKDKFGESNQGKEKTIVIDYSAPNVAKRFSIGHLRSTIIGQAIYNLYQALGYTVIGDNHLGDWGTQFGMIIAAIKQKNLNIKDLSVKDLEELYIDYNNQIKENPDLREVAKNWFKKLEEGDQEARQIWQSAVDLSLSEFQKIYDQLEVKIDKTYGESFYEDKMSPIVKAAREKGILQESEGAEIIELDNMPPAMLLKSDGTTTYLTRDLAAIKYRIDTWHPVEIIYEVGVEQKLHFEQVFAAAEKLGWVDNVELKHIPHGHYRMKGKKMSTRKGTNIHLEDILEEAVKRAKELGSESKETAEAVGIGAIKYFDLRHSPETFIDFDWQAVMSMQGNSGPYLQYTFARTQSVLHKADKKPNPEIKSPNPEELAVMRSLIKFPEVIADAAEKYSPNLLCTYLYDLAQKFNTFYNMHRILNSNAHKPFRLALTEATGIIIQKGLSILGIQAPEKM